jgi:hypothetical protein
MREKPMRENFDDRVDRIARDLRTIVTDNGCGSASIAALQLVLNQALEVRAIFEKHDTRPIVWH